jgi:hypothetical protein
MRGQTTMRGHDNAGTDGTFPIFRDGSRRPVYLGLPKNNVSGVSERRQVGIEATCVAILVGYKPVKRDGHPDDYFGQWFLRVNQAYDRLLKNDVKYRFVIDIASLR